MTDKSGATPAPALPFTHDNIGDAIQQAHAAAEQYQKPTLVSFPHPDDETFVIPGLVTRQGFQAVPKAAFDEYRAHPERRTGTATLTRLESLIDHIKRFKDEDSVLYALDNRTAPRLTAVLDYHESGAGGTPRFGEHRSVFAFPLSDEWRAWNAADGKKMSMIDFAAFLEDRIVDVELVEDPTALNEDIRRFIGATGLDRIAGPSKLMELAKGLQVNESSVIKQVHNMSSGEGQIRFESEHTDASGAPVDVPGLFIICVPVFAHDGYYRIAARLRYRKTNEGITFWYDLWRTDLVFDDAFDKACARVRDETGLPLLIGTPE